MTTVDLNTIELNEFKGKDNPQQHCRATFPLVGAHGSEKLATVYFELQPGDMLGRHTDSAEELLVILEGKVEAIVGEDTAKAETGSLVLIPEMVPHNLRNVGNTTARVLGVFGGTNNIVATFDNILLPPESRVVDTEAMFNGTVSG